ncbi:neurofilament heavy polypeptide-like [Penaeus vannamei]|uniref:neurofilament heavy polypeptide-like n=1 Tax=Penaeus vannamei TaxID=6689 RepID=UPI00387FAB55
MTNIKYTKTSQKDLRCLRRRLFISDKRYGDYRFSLDEESLWHRLWDYSVLLLSLIIAIEASREAEAPGRQAPVPDEAEQPVPDEAEQPVERQAPVPDEPEQPVERQAPVPDEPEQPVERQAPVPEEKERKHLAEQLAEEEASVSDGLGLVESGLNREYGNLCSRSIGRRDLRCLRRRLFISDKRYGDYRFSLDEESLWHRLWDYSVLLLSLIIAIEVLTSKLLPASREAEAPGRQAPVADEAEQPVPDEAEQPVPDEAEQPVERQAPVPDEPEQPVERQAPVPEEKERKHLAEQLAEEEASVSDGLWWCVCC